ncbi:putative retrotransposon [Cucumis melo var. makuwa]|uniref:Retrotransposon n=1 Tax=Cucumis melo var. makuwa TaxID=1194695 RepID=A0A5A7V9H2_CUCMM|nr:putative retrotransposon [Cucumis melo var. makuwa]TYK15923.1 putative retrotransposon [Cucumis melo var. makuwa]
MLSVTIAMKKGHIKKYCRKLKRDSKNHKGKEKKNDDDSDADTITVATQDLYILSDGDVVNLATQQSSWVIDNVLGWAMTDQQMQLSLEIKLDDEVSAIPSIMAYGSLLKFHASIERETGEKLKCVKTDNGEDEIQNEQFFDTDESSEQVGTEDSVQEQLAEIIVPPNVSLRRSTIKQEHTSEPRYKARLVVKGFSQKKRIDFDEIFAPIIKMSSIRVALSLAASLDLEVEQMDVQTAFLHGNLDKEIYMEQSEGFEQKGKEHLLCNLNKSLYGLKQASRQWYKKFEIDSSKKQLSKSFAVKDLGPAKKVLGIRIVRDRASKKLCMSQEQYIEKSPSTNKEKENMNKISYASVVGSLMYVVVCTRPDIAHVIGVVSHFMSNSGKQHWEAVKCIMRYLRGIFSLKLTFGDGKSILADSDMIGDLDSRKSTSSYLMTFASYAVS